MIEEQKVELDITDAYVNKQIDYDVKFRWKLRAQFVKKMTPEPSRSHSASRAEIWRSQSSFNVFSDDSLNENI